MIKARALCVLATCLATAVLGLESTVAEAHPRGAHAPRFTASGWPVYGHDLANSRDAGRQGPSPRAAGSLERAWAFPSSTGDFTGTPVVAGGVLVAGNNGGWVYALKPSTGQLLWSRDIGQSINGSAAIDPRASGGGVAFVPVDQYGGPRLVALSLRDGAVRWDVVLTRQPDSEVFGSPVYWRGTVYIGTAGIDVGHPRGSVVALDEATGHVRWQTFTVPPGDDGGGVWSTPAIDTRTGLLYVGTGQAYDPPAAGTTDSIMALDAATGEDLDHYQATAGDVFNLNISYSGPDADFGASPNLITGPTGQPLVGEGQKSGAYYALARGTVQPVWGKMVGLGSPLGGILGSTAYDGARIYGTDGLSGVVWALGRDGATAWSSADHGHFDLGPVAVSNGVLYTVDPTGLLVVREASSGAVVNKLVLGEPSCGGISIANGTVYVAVGQGPLGTDRTGFILAFRPSSRSPS